MQIKCYAAGEWVNGAGEGRELVHAVSGERIGFAGSEGIDFKGMLDYGASVGGPALRKMTFHQRALMLKEVAKYLLSCKDKFYQLSEATGATKKDSWIDIEGGIGTFFTYSGKGRRELPDSFCYVDGPVEPLSKEGTFVGRHICVPLEGTAVHINAFNFPCWGMLEKLAPTFLAGMPAIIKPATATCYLTEAMVRAMIDSKLIPEGALQLICGSVGDMFDHLSCQDVVTFTGSAETGKKLKSHPMILENSVRFNMEADSLNCSILGSDAEPGSPEFDLFIKEVAREMTVKAGQKCTAIRRTIVPNKHVDAVIEALSARLAKTTLGNPANESVRMGPLVSREQVEEVRRCVDKLSEASEIVYGDLENFEVVGADPAQGAFFPAMLLHCKQPLRASIVHEVEPFGPVSTVMGYDSNSEAIELAKMGKGSLVGSLFTADDKTAREITLGCAPYHGRMLLINRQSAAESTGHGSPMPHLVHGGPGRAGGGEELGGIRSVFHFMQRTAIQGSPTTLTEVCSEYTEGATPTEDKKHPFRKYFEEISVGDQLITDSRTVTEEDIVNFANLSGDKFYAHMDEEAAAANEIFGARVAHGYFIISAAAGLFVDPAPGPVLANYGLENLRFTKPVYIGDTFKVRFTCKRKARKYGQKQGIVEWDCLVTNQDEEMVATYSILTLVAAKEEVEVPTADGLH